MVFSPLFFELLSGSRAPSLLSKLAAMKTVGAALKVGATAAEFRERAGDLPLRTSAQLLLKLVTVHAYQAHRYVLQARKVRCSRVHKKDGAAESGVGGGDNVADASRINRKVHEVGSRLIDESLFDDDDDEMFLSSGSESEGDFHAHTAPENALSMSGRVGDGGGRQSAFALGDFDDFADDFGGGFEFEADGADDGKGNYSNYKHFYDRNGADAGGSDPGDNYGGFDDEDDDGGGGSGFDDDDNENVAGVVIGEQHKNVGGKPDPKATASRGRLWKTIEGPSRIESAMMQMSINDTR
jgi:hypothetical protein